MVAWRAVVDAAPEFADRVQRLFDAHKHKTLATLRTDGSPRISGIEAQFVDGELWFGSMPGAVKALDLLRDPRFALHGPSVDADDSNPSAWPGDAKLAGRAVEVTDPAEFDAAYRAMGGDPAQYPGSHLFKADIHEVVVTRVGDPPDHLLIELWRPDAGLRRIERK